MNTTNLFLSLVAVVCMATGVAQASAPAQNECSICIEPATNAVTTPCQHIFCYECLTEWKAKGKNNCPNCNQETLDALQLTPPKITAPATPALRPPAGAAKLHAILREIRAGNEIPEAALWDFNADELLQIAAEAARNGQVEKVAAVTRLITNMREEEARTTQRPIAPAAPVVAGAYGHGAGFADDEIPAEILAASRAAVDEDELLRRALENSRRTHEEGERRRAATAAATYASAAIPAPAIEQTDWHCPECHKEQGKFADHCRDCMNRRGKRVARPLAAPAHAPRTAGGAVGGYGTPAAHPVVAPTATWKCPVKACGHLNAIDQEKCAKCWEFEIVTERPIIAPRATVPAPIALPAPAPRTAGGAVGGYGAPAAHPVVARGADSWTCDICTCINDPVMPQCEACGVERS